jgi:quercetin dioxygenase-like cupin family protein
MEPMREPQVRRERLEEDRVHVLPLAEYVDALRGEREYADHGHTGVTLMKTEALRVVLEVVRAGEGLGEHVVDGPATVQILEGSLEFQTTSGRFAADAGTLVVLPHGEPRTVEALEESTFLLALSLSQGG